MRKYLTIVAVATAVLALGASVAAQSPPRASAPPTVTIVAARATTSVDGATLYQAYCASCHGRDGKGNGPAVHALRTPAPDLTRIGVTHTDTDCVRHVMQEFLAGHRSSSEPKVSENDLDMPNWAPIFYAMWTSSSGVATMRMRNVARHVNSIQEAR